MFKFRPQLVSGVRPKEEARRIEFDRFGMDNEDWRHLNDYWRAMYGDEYPHEKEANREIPLPEGEQKRAA